MTSSVLVVGGYGVIGRRAVRLMASQFDSRLVVAGRRPEAAAALAREVGRGVRARSIDVEDAASVRAGLRDAAVVVCCVEQQSDLVLRHAIERGIGYADLAPKLAFGRDVLALDEAAKHTGARLLMGVGIAPGLSSVIARALCNRLDGPPDTIESALLYGMGDEFGRDSLGFIARSATTPFVVVENGEPRSVLPLREPAEVEFPAPIGRRHAYVHGFSDATMFPSTLGARTARSRLAIDPSWMGRLATAAARLHLLGLLSHRIGGSPWLHTRLRAHDHFALVVHAQRGAARQQMSLCARGQADATAIVVAALVRRLVDGGPGAPGLWMPEQYVEPDAFFAELADAGLVVEGSAEPKQRATG